VVQVIVQEGMMRKHRLTYKSENAQ